MTVNTDLREYTLTGYDGARQTLLLELLGQGSSHAVGKRRWFEVFIYADEAGEYVVHTVGRTTLANETDRCRIERTPSPFEVVEVLTVSRVGHDKGATREERRRPPYIPVASLRALARAADVDDGIREAYLRLAA